MDNIYNLNIERAVLSSILFDYEIIEQISEMLKPTDFYLPAHSAVYDCILKLYSENMPIDEDFIRKRIEVSVVSDSVLIEILTANAISNVMAYVQDIREGSKKRELLKISTEIKKRVIESEISANEVSDYTKNCLDNLDSDIENIEDFNGQEIMNTEFEHVPTYMTGIEAIDSVDTGIGGVQNGQLIYVTGLEETGKTHITYKIMENISEGRKTGIISLEFGKEKLKDRLSGMIKNGSKLKPSNIKASFNCHSIIKLEKTVRKWASDGCKFIVVDSINLVENHAIRDRFERVLNVGTRLFKLVQALNITMFVISTSTKEDNKNGNPSIYGGQLLNNYCHQKWHIFRDFETEDRMLWINKNKQNFKYPKIDLQFDDKGNIYKKGEFYKTSCQPTETTTYDYVPENNADIPDIEF